MLYRFDKALMAAILASVLIVALLALAACIAVCNWVILYLNVRDRKVPEHTHSSSIGMAAQIFVIFAALISGHFEVTWIPNSVYWSVALIDISLWQLIAFPFVLTWMGIVSLIKRNA